MPNIDWGRVIELGIAAVVGAVAIATYLLTRRGKQRFITVKVSNGMHAAGAATSEWMLFVTAMNPGERAVSLESTGFLLPNGSSLVIFGSNTTTGLPVDLQEGQSVMAWVELAEVVTQLRQAGYRGRVKLRGFVRSAIGAEYKSKPWKIDLDRERT